MINGPIHGRDWSDTTWKAYIQTVGIDQFRGSNAGQKTLKEIADYVALADGELPKPKHPRKKLIPVRDPALLRELRNLETNLSALAPKIETARSRLLRLYSQQRDIREKIKALNGRPSPAQADFAMAANGLTVAQIAASRGVQKQTVKTNIEHHALDKAYDTLKNRHPEISPYDNLDELEQEITNVLSTIPNFAPSKRYRYRSGDQE